jgi:hypothetical protein
MANHGARDHATWSASSTARNWTCAGAIALAAEINTPEVESSFAAWGTACHQVSEKCLRSGGDAADLIDTIEKTKQHSFTVDEEMAETAQVYIDYVRGRLAKYKAETGDDAQFWIEQHFSLNDLNTPFDAGGTSDFVMYFPKWRLLEVVDLKGGRGVVEAAGNKQMRTYGLGTMLAHPGLDIEKVKVTIVQPRAPHKEGRVRSDDFHVADLLEWTADLLRAMHRSKEASDNFGKMPFAAWWAKYLTPGNCTFCPREGTCPALEQKAFDTVGVWFTEQDEPRIANAPDSGTPDQIAASLDLLDMIQDWMNARRAYAHQQAELGVVIPNYVLVPKQGREKWNDDTEETVLLAAQTAGLKAEKYLNAPKLKTPKQVRKALGKTHEALVEGLSFTPSEGTNLVRQDKTTRTAVGAAVNNFFTEIPD